MLLSSSRKALINLMICCLTRLAYPCCYKVHVNLVLFDVEYCSTVIVNYLNIELGVENANTCFLKCKYLTVFEGALNVKVFELIMEV